MSEGDIKKNGWNDWANHVLITLKDLKKEHEETDKKINALIVELRVMQTKMSQRAGLMGAIAGAVPSIVALVIVYIKSNA